MTMNGKLEKIDLHRRRLVGAAAATAAVAQLGVFAAIASEQKPRADIGFLEIDKDITLRRMVVSSPAPQGTVLFLHGFPETLYAWKDISLALAADYEVHAFDWPGYGLSSRPAADAFSYAPRDYARVLGE
jgi:pimeloyl-ACP methyl ester carboxylesterase